MAPRKKAPVIEVGPSPEDICKEYQRDLEKAALNFQPSLGKYPASYIGPVWRLNDDGTWHLPNRTLGWECLVWCYENLQYSAGVPWKFTPEQARFILWWYAIDENFKFLYHEGILQRLKGWGKDPLAACLCLFELLGPCRFGGIGEDGFIYGKPHLNAWVQTAAVSLEQTKNTMRLIPGLLTKQAKREYSAQVGKEQVYAVGGERFFQAVTSSAATLEGARPTFTLKNETQHWLSSNDGHAMSEVISRNASKAPDGASRILSITNAPEPNKDSVGERDRQAFDKGELVGVLYDSIEAPPEAPLTIEDAPEVIAAIRGDSYWLDANSIAIREIGNPRITASQKRRFWYNQVVATEDRWIAPFEWHPLFKESKVNLGTAITLGFDGSRTRKLGERSSGEYARHGLTDATALIACRVTDGMLFEPLPSTVWEHPPGLKEWEVPTDEVNRAVDEVFQRYNVVGFFADPAKWESWIAQWEARYGVQLMVKASQRHPIEFWFGGDQRKARTIQVLDEFRTAVANQEVSHTGSHVLTRHILNCRTVVTNSGIHIAKENPDSNNKIDAAIAAVLAHHARKEALALGIGVNVGSAPSRIY